MARIRSPNYPAIGLADAIERARKVYDLQAQTSEPRDVVAKHLGYNSLNGAALKVLSALIKYELLTEANDNELKISDQAVSILFPENDSEKAAAIMASAKSPALFAEIYDRWEGKRPSEASLRAHLVRRQFAPSAIDSVIGAFFDTYDLVTRESEGYDSKSDNNADDDENREFEDASMTPDVPKAAPLNLAKGFDIGFVGTAIRMSGTVSSKAEAAKVIDALTALQALLPEDDQKNEPDAG